ncbi:MAG: response regulator, partial [Roseibium sp.]
MKTIYNVVLVEDEKDAQESLFKLLQKWKNIEVVGFASSIQEAEELVSRLKPDLVFCDVMLPPYIS